MNAWTSFFFIIVLVSRFGVPTYLQDAQSHASNSGDWPALHLSVHGHMHAQEDVIIWQGRQGTRGLVQAPNNFCLGSAKVFREPKFVSFYLGNMDHKRYVSYRLVGIYDFEVNKAHKANDASSC